MHILWKTLILEPESKRWIGNGLRGQCESPVLQCPYERSGGWSIFQRGAGDSGRGKTLLAGSSIFRRTATDPKRDHRRQRTLPDPRGKTDRNYMQKNSVTMEKFMFLEAVIWRRNWFRCSAIWASGVWSWMTGKNIPIRFVSGSAGDKDRRFYSTFADSGSKTGGLSGGSHERASL